VPTSKQGKEEDHGKVFGVELSGRCNDVHRVWRTHNTMVSQQVRAFFTLKWDKAQNSFTIVPLKMIYRGIAQIAHAIKDHCDQSRSSLAT